MKTRTIPQEVSDVVAGFTGTPEELLAMLHQKGYIFWRLEVEELANAAVSLDVAANRKRRRWGRRR